MWKRRPGAVTEINWAPRFSRRVLNLGCLQGPQKACEHSCKFMQQFESMFISEGSGHSFQGTHHYKKLMKLGLVLPTAGRLPCPSQLSWRKWRWWREAERSEATHTTTKSARVTGPITGASRSLHRTELNTSWHNYEARLGISPSEQSFSGMGNNHVAAENVIVVGPNC